MTGKRDWSKIGLGVYFVVFLIFLYGPIIVMTILSFTGPRGRLTFPLDGADITWWRSLFDPDAPLTQAKAIRNAGETSLLLALATGAIVSFLALSLSMAFRRRFRGDSILFVLVLLCLMTPGFLLAFGTTLFWTTMGFLPEIWRTALGTNAIWALPFGFLIMVAIWNRYDARVEEAARDLGASAATTFREITVPLIWTGLLGTFLFGFTLSWNEFDRTSVLLGTGNATLPTLIFGLSTGSVIRPNLYALGAFTTAVTFFVLGLFLVIAAIYYMRRRRMRTTLDVQVQEELGEVVGAEGAGAGARAR